MSEVLRSAPSRMNRKLKTTAARRPRPAHYQMMKQYIVEEISAWDEGTSFAYIVTDTTAPITDGILEWSVDGDDRRSVIKVRGSYRPKGLMGRLMLPTLRKQFASQMKAGLADMKRHLETPAAWSAKTV